VEEAIEISLRTWYPKDHPLHNNPHLPLGKLLGEWGELLDDYADANKTDDTKFHLMKLLAKWGKLMDDYMKSLYKPGYEFEPEDELGDIWYYIRVLCWQRDHKPENAFEIKVLDRLQETDYIIAKTAGIISSSFLTIAQDYNYHISTLDYVYSALVEIARRYNLTLDQLTASNWEKLKPGSERGEQWMKAR
jgi:hypothetical protein